MASGFRDRYGRLLKVAVQVGIALTILLSLATVGFIQYSGQPGFCNRCHIMRPYYESWATSSHNQVPCIKCHYAPGIKAEAMGKIQAANQVVKYLTGAYGTKPWAEIEDAACTRSGCHATRALEGKTLFRGVLFDHAQHLGELRRGKQLRCTSCHSQIVQGQHVTVTASTCFLCHFKDRPAGQPIAGCTGCHTAPPRIVSPAGFVVDHPQYVRDLVSCVSCHRQVTVGEGSADRQRCFNCHNEPARLEQFANTALVHRVHIAEHNVECLQCHMPIEHRVVALAPTFALDCATCHRGVHEAQQRLYAGLGGHGTPERPSSMFLANVACQACHELPASGPGHEQVRRAGEAACMSCHGTRYANILPAWREEMERKVNAVAGVLEGARAALAGMPPARRSRADSLLRLARENLELVELGRGAHNVAYADQLLRATLGLVRRAVQGAGLPYRMPAVNLGPPVAETTCLQCHLGTERREARFAGKRFPHDRHVVQAGLACTRCHTPVTDHGKTVLQASDCSSCHHQRAGASSCGSCHGGGTGAPDTAVSFSVGRFPHGTHLAVGLDCATCHAPPAMRPDPATCATCHELHHQPEADCLACHQGGVKEKHDRSFAHNACQDCHGERVAGITAVSRQVCTVCHVDRVDHNAPLSCDQCHDVKPWGKEAADQQRPGRPPGPRATKPQASDRQTR
jgi:nitrate/TMAO reductase-like tetraheme cytochrome c subunit